MLKAIVLSVESIIGSKMKTALVTGSQGFLMSYLCEELLANKYIVYGIDNYSKYGRIERAHDRNYSFALIEQDLTKIEPPIESIRPEYIVLGAAVIGGIGLFHRVPGDIYLHNELILAKSFQGILKALGTGWRPKRVVYVSSSMVFEGADFEFDKLDSLAAYNCCGPQNFSVDPKSVWPSKEQAVLDYPPPLSAYGRQKLSGEWFIRAMAEQYDFPFTIVRPFNGVGPGENDYKSGDSHVIPDLAWKILNGADPLPIKGNGDQVRCYTHGKDIAIGIRLAMESNNGINEDFNISVPQPTSVLELAGKIWKEIRGEQPFNYVFTESYKHDVQRRLPDVTKAKELLEFEAKIPLEYSIKEVVSWMKGPNDTSLEIVNV